MECKVPWTIVLTCSSAFLSSCCHSHGTSDFWSFSPSGLSALGTDLAKIRKLISLAIIVILQTTVSSMFQVVYVCTLFPPTKRTSLSFLQVKEDSHCLLNWRCVHYLFRINIDYIYTDGRWFNNAIFCDNLDEVKVCYNITGPDQVYVRELMAHKVAYYKWTM